MFVPSIFSKFAVICLKNLAVAESVTLVFSAVHYLSSYAKTPNEFF